MLSAAFSAEAQVFHFQSDQVSTADGAALCLAVDAKKPLVPAPGARVTPPDGGEPFALTDTFYPVVAQRCDALDETTPSAWQPSDTRELRVTVDKKPMCLSARNLTSFTPLLEPFLRVFKADQPGSPFAYLMGDLKPGGVVNDKRLNENPDFVVGPCGRLDASDGWQYDDLSGTISGPNMGSRRQCLTMHGDWSKRPLRHESGMPVSAANCADYRTFNRADNPAYMRWKTTTGQESLPKFPPLGEPGYFSGAAGLPITGPLGRCLTADYAAKGVVTSECDGRVEQRWQVVGAAIRLGADGECLEAQRDGALKTGLCSAGKPEQQWRYQVAQPDPNPGWRNSDVYGQIFSGSTADKCLSVRDDPFVDPARQRNPVRIAACAAELSRKTSWFIPDQVRTIRVAIIRFSDDDGSKPAMGTTSDDAVKSTTEALVAYLSDYYQALGVRFVFDPAHDLLRVNNTAANQIGRTGTNQLGPESENVLHRIAGNETYGKLTVALMVNMGGGNSCGTFVDYDRGRIIDPISNSPMPSLTKVPGQPNDRAGLPAYCRVVHESFVSRSAGSVSHEAHEFGHYFGLWHTFDGGGLKDIPADTKENAGWHQRGVEYCGNARSGIVKGVTYTPDRTNNESYWGCITSRVHNSFSPQQLGKMLWTLNQMHRYPIVACQPLRAYDANHVECENAESLALCQETAAYLKAKTGTEMECRAGGVISRAMTDMLRMPAIGFVLQNSAEGQAILKKLAGVPLDAQLSLVALGRSVESLGTCANLPLCMAMVSRLSQLQALASQQSPALAKSGFVPDGKEIAGTDQQVLIGAARQVFPPGFIVNVPALAQK